jgi:hypothetical protein
MQLLTLRPAQLELADEMYFLTHDDITGAAQLNGRAMDYALAGCLIGELVWSGWAVIEGVGLIHGGLLTAVDLRAAAPPDFPDNRSGKVSTVPALWRQLVAEPWRLPVRIWLDAVSPNVQELVVARLITAGHLTKAGRRRHVPANPSIAGNTQGRLCLALHYLNGAGWEAYHLKDVDIFLLLLADAAGLRPMLLDRLEPAGRDVANQFIDWYRDSLPAQRPDLADLITQTSSAVASCVVTRGPR